MWVRAGIKRILGINLFHAGHELFWVRFPQSREELDTIRSYVEDGNLKPSLDSVVDLDDAGVQGVFEKLNSRRTKGKLSVKMVPDAGGVVGEDMDTTDG